MLASGTLPCWLYLAVKQTITKVICTNYKPLIKNNVFKCFLFQIESVPRVKYIRLCNITISVPTMHLHVDSSSSPRVCPLIVRRRISAMVTVSCVVNARLHDIVHKYMHRVLSIPSSSYSDGRSVLIGVIKKIRVLVYL